MLGLLKLVTIVAASLLVLDAAGRFDWTPYVHDPAIPLGADLLIQGKRDVVAQFARAPWFPALSQNAFQIEVGLAVAGGALLMAANRLSVLGYLGNVFLCSIALGVLFLLAGPGREVIAGHPWQFDGQGGAWFPRSASQAPGMIGQGAGELAYGGSDMEPGQWTVTGYTTMTGVTMPTQALSRCFSYGKVREMMATGEGFIDPGSTCPAGLERHGNVFSGSSQCGAAESSVRIVLDSPVRLTADSSLTLGGRPWIAIHVEASRTGPC
jgi:hypothetical protein